MYVIMTYFRHQQVCPDAALCAEERPIGLEPLFFGKSAFEHNLIMLGQLGMTRLHILTDDMADQIEQSRIYQACRGLVECCVESVEESQGDWGGKRFLQLIDEAQEPVIWIRGDVVIDESILRKVFQYEGDCFVKTYSGTVVKQLDADPIKAEQFLQEVMFAHRAADGTTALPVVKLQSKRILHQIEDKLDQENEFKELKIVPVICSGYLAFPMTTLEAEELDANIRLRRTIQQRAYGAKSDFEMLKAWLSQMDKSRILLVIGGALTLKQQGIVSLLEGVLTIEMNGEADAATSILPERQIEYIITCGDETAIRFARRFESVFADEEAPQMVFIADVQALCASGEIMTDGVCRDLERPAKIFVDFEQFFGENERLLLCSHIWASAICGILSASKLPAQCFMYNALLMRFSGAKKICALNLINIAVLVRRMECLGNNLYLHAMADSLCAQSGWPYAHALLGVCACMVSYLKNNMRHIKVSGGRRALLADALDEIMIGFGVTEDYKLMDVLQTFLYQTGIELDGEQLAQQITDHLSSDVWPSEANSIFVLDQKKIGDIFRVPGLHSLASKLRECEQPYEQMSNYEVQRKAERLRRNEVFERLKLEREQLILKIADWLKQRNIDFWLLQDGYDEQLLMMPWDIEKALPDLERDMAELCFVRRICSDVARFSDVFVYLKGTCCESEWNINAFTSHKGIGISIQSVVPREHFTQEKLVIAETLDRILLNRREYRGFGLEKEQIAAFIRFAPVSLGKIESIRDRMLKLPAQGSAVWSKTAVCDLRQKIVFPIDLQNAKKIDMEGREISVIDASEFAPKSPSPTPCYVCFGKNDAYALRTPKLNKTNITLKTAMRLFVKNCLKDIKREVMNRTEKLRGWLSVKLMKPARIQSKLILSRIHGMRRRMGLLLTPAEQELRSLGGKYKGQRCFLVGNGPSLKAEDLDMIRDEITLGCNFIHKIYAQTKWRPTYHFISDSSTVRTACWDLVRNQDFDRTTMVVRDFAYQAMTVKPPKAIIAPSISMVEYYVSSNFLAYHYISHATVMSMMLEAAMYMGFSEIYLIGVDATTSSDKGGNFAANYFTPEQRAKLNEIKKRAIKNYDVAARRREIAERQRMVYGKIRERAEARGIHIYNATRGGALEVFDRVNLDDIVKERK